MPEPRPAAGPEGTRFNYHAVWTVTDPADGLGLEPIAPPRIRRIMEELWRRLIEQDGNSQAVVGAVSVTCQQAPNVEALDALDATEVGELRYQYRAPGPEQAKTTGTYTHQAFAVGELEPDELDPSDGYHNMDGECPCGQDHSPDWGWPDGVAPELP